jgi:hypothetical protein
VLALTPAHSNTLWTILSALGVILTVIATHIRGNRDRAIKQEETTAQVAAVQETVNGTTGKLVERVDQLGSALTSVGVTLPAPPTRKLSEASEDELRAALLARGVTP